MTLFDYSDTLERMRNRLEEIGCKEITRILFLEGGIEVEWE